MNVSYKRTSNQSYMIITGDAINVGFEEAMLRENSVASLLDFHTMEVNGETQFWYDITGKKSMRDFFEQEGITLETLRMVFEKIGEAYERLSDFLIAEEHVCISPDLVFFPQGTQTGACLCYCPMEHMSYDQQLQSVVEYLLSVVDHRKVEVTRICYEMYEITNRNQFTILDLLSVMEKEETPVLVEPLREVSEDEIREAARLVGEDFFEEEKEPRSLLSYLKEKIAKYRNQFTRKKQELFPEEDYLQDIEFDEFVPESHEETKTVLLSENVSACCGKLIHDGGNSSEDFYISKTPFRIGSKPGGNDGVIASSSVSRYHAKITKREGIFYLQDLNSTNGTCVNGKVLSYKDEVPLKANDVITFADEVYRIV